MRQKASANRIWEDFLALGAIGGDDERKGGNEEVKEFEKNERVRNYKKKKGSWEVFIEGKER